MFYKNSLYSLRKSKKIFRHVHSIYKRKKKKLSSIQQKRFENILTALQTAIIKKNRKAADRGAKNLEKLALEHLKKTIYDQILDSFLALVFAVVVAIIVRQMWFEFYTIPTGSMRPTLKEKDFLTVSKTDFSINVPLLPSHFYFDKKLLNRGSIVIFTTANLDIADPNMLYFYIFPGKKQFVKRLVGKPGDTLYFYGGRIYGIDAQGNAIKELYNSKWFKEIEHIPFITFPGKVVTPSKFSEDIYSPVIFYQMNEPLAMLNISPVGTIESEILTKHASVFTKNTQIKNYYDFWGFKNFAMTRILSKNEVEKYSNASAEDIEDAAYYLELTHHPSLVKSRIIRDKMGRLRPGLNYSTSLIALDENIFQEIFNNIYTARFCIKDGSASLYNSKNKTSSYYPKIKNVPDGCYEYEDGKAYKINILGVSKKLSEDHPLNVFSIENTKLLYNLGIEFNTVYLPHKKNQDLIPSRYAYFRDKSLYLMGSEIIKKGNPILVHFLDKEYKKQSLSSLNNQYIPFEDLGPPIDKDGNLNKALIRKYGITVPDKMYLTLGDNHAMSADSRVFGFVPEDNLKGGANFIFWPPSKRWGRPFQPPFNNFSLPKITIWSSALVILLISFFIVRRKTISKLKF